MPNYSKKIVYLTQAQYQELTANNTITVDGVTVNYNDNDIYVTPQAEPITDVKINGSSIGSNGIANIPKASSTTLGVISIGNGLAINQNGVINIDKAIDANIKAGTHQFLPIVPEKQDLATFYGLSKVAGVDLASVTCTVGEYPDSSKDAIQNMLGVSGLISTRESALATTAHAINSTFLLDGKLVRATTAIAAADAVAIGTNCEVVKADEVFVKNTDYATANTPGIVKVEDTTCGLRMSTDGTYIRIVGASTNKIKNGTEGYCPITPSTQHYSIYYGLSKLAGVDLKNETVTLGTYPENSKTAIRSLIGAGEPLDVQINGTSIVSTGVANIPLGAENSLGVVKVALNGTGGLFIDSNGTISAAVASSGELKYGTHNGRVVSPGRQHESVFYGLSKAAGVDLASVTCTVGTYPTAAQSAIQTMLGVEKGVDLVETITGTTPSITAAPNVRYVCGEVSTISITPPVGGTCDIIFESGSTASVLTVPNTVKWPTWFDATALETDTIYEIMITDATYGSVMTWAAS